MKVEAALQNPFSKKYNDSEDEQLIHSALNGSRTALEALVKKHQHYIYNIAHKMVLSPFDAEDITQEVLIKMITKLSQFKGESNFRTWLYRITFNHFLQMKKYWLEDLIVDFEKYGNELDEITDEALTQEQQTEMKELIVESKLSCMSGMLLCLNREQRLVYVLGEIFGADHNIGAALLNISKDNFRQRLSRARKDLYQFMSNKCGLVNTNNPCRCDKKTNGFIKAGWVDETKMKFNTSYLKSIADTIQEKSNDLDKALDAQYANLFQQHPFQEKPHAEKLMQSVLTDKTLLGIFNLN